MNVKTVYILARETEKEYANRMYQIASLFNYSSTIQIYDLDTLQAVEQAESIINEIAQNTTIIITLCANGCIPEELIPFVAYAKIKDKEVYLI